MRQGDLIFSIAKREVTFFSASEPIAPVKDIVAPHVGDDDAQHVVDVSDLW